MASGVAVARVAISCNTAARRGAMARSPGERKRLRDESASPSASRTVGTAQSELVPGNGTRGVVGKAPFCRDRRSG